LLIEGDLASQTEEEGIEALDAGAEVLDRHYAAA
jgi:hypothetical protein